MRKIFFPIWVLGMACASWGQTSQAAWTNLNPLHAGQKVQVIEVNSKKHSGTFVSVSDTAISYQDTAGEQTIPKENVRSVKLMETEHRMRNTLIGAAAGAGVGAGIGAASSHSCSSQSFCIEPVGRGEFAAIGAAVGLLCGAGVGALVTSHKTIYRVSSP
jgi:hypothetical protein